MDVRGSVQTIEQKGVVLDDDARDKARNDSENNGLVKGVVVWLDMTVRVPGQDRPLDSEGIIAAGLAYNTVLGLRDESGRVVAVIEGNGPDRDDDGNVTGLRFPTGHRAEGKAVPEGGYKIDGAEGIGVGISPWEHSNGLRNRFHINREGYFYPFGSVNGVPANFGGDDIRVGKARPKPKNRPHE